MSIVEGFPGHKDWAKGPQQHSLTYHSRSLYIIVKKTCRKRLTAFISTASRYSHASPDIICASGPLQATSTHEAGVEYRIFLLLLAREQVVSTRDLVDSLIVKLVE